jgi:prevent-host-death family protein
MPNTVKLIPLSAAKARLSQYGRLRHDEPVIVTVNGVPSFQLVPLEEDDDLIGRLLEHHPSFRKMLEARLRERSVTAREALKRL